MLMQGTTTRTYQQIAEELDSLGGTLNAATGADSLVIDGKRARGECREAAGADVRHIAQRSVSDQ